MRPPSRKATLVVLVSTFVLGLTFIGVVGSAVTETDTTDQTSSEPVIVENGSTYDVSQTLQFNVSRSNDTYEIRTEDDAYVDMVAAENGAVTFDTSGMNGGTYVLIHHDSETTEYEFTLESTATTTTSTTTTEDSATTVEDGGHYEIPAQLSFENLEEGDSYELRKGDENVYVDQFQPATNRIQLDTEGLNPGEYSLIHTESDEIVYQFTLEGEETTVEQTTTVTTSTTTSIETTTRETATTQSTTSITEETSTRTSLAFTENTSTALKDSSSTSQPETTIANQNEGYYPSVPGFGFESGIIAFVSGGILLLRRYQ